MESAEFQINVYMLTLTLLYTNTADATRKEYWTMCKNLQQSGELV